MPSTIHAKLKLLFSLFLRRFQTFQLFFFLLLLRQTVAQPPAFSIQELTVNDGLSQGFVTAFCQDHRGFLWIGTTNGLNRYDGYSIRIFNGASGPKGSPGNMAVSCLATDPSGLLWIGTTDGLYILDPESARFLLAGNLCPELPAAAVSGLYCSRGGILYVSVQSDNQSPALFRLQLPATLREALQTDRLKGARLAAKRVTADSGLATLPDRILGAISDSVLLLKNKSDRLFYYTETNGAVQPLAYSQARRWADPTADILWTGAAGFYFKREAGSSTGQIIPLISNTVFFRLGPQKTFCYQVSKSELFEIGPVSGTSPATPLALPFPGRLVAKMSGPFSRAIFADRSGNVWIGTIGYGARALKLNRMPYEHLFPNYSAFNFRLTDSTHVWMGKTHPNDLFQVKTKKIEPAPWAGKLPRTFHLHNVITDQAGNFWLSGQLDSVSRLIVFHPVSGSMQLLPEQLKSYSYVAEQLYSDRQGNLWVGAHNGLCLRYRPGARQPEAYSYRQLFPPGRVELRSNAMLQTAGGDLFIGTSQGLVRVAHPDSVPAFSLFQNDPGNPASLGCNPVLSLFADSSAPNFLWVGTQGGGLNRLDLKSGIFTRFTEAEGLLNNVIYGILSDASHKLWLSSNRGISLFDPSSGTCNNFQKSDGLSAGEFNTGAALQLPNGQLLFGSVDGLILLHPKAFNLPAHPIPVAITNVNILGIPSSTRDVNIPASGSWQNLRLKSNQNNLIFEFAGLDFVNPATNRFRYRLKGLDDRWINNGTQRTANYSGLPPGQYTFEVQAATALGQWSEEPARLSIAILPPWYRSWWAYAVYALAFISLNLFYIRFRENRLLLQKTVEIAQQESFRLRELDVFKNRLLANITHEFRTPLTLILSLAEYLYLGKRTDTGNISKGILQQGENLLELLNQIADLSSLSENKVQLKFRQGNISNAILYFAESLRSLATEKNIALTVHSDVPDLVMDFDSDRLRQVIVNLLSNAIRHTPPNGSAAIWLAVSDSNHFIIRVSNSGEGITPEDLPHVFERFYQGSSQQMTGASGLGLALTKDLVSLFGGTVEAESTPGAGSVFTVSLPITNQAKLQENNPMYSDYLIASANVIPTKSNSPLIIVIEDNPVIAGHLHACLAPSFQVLEAPDGEKGVSMVAEWVPDLVITDLTIPGKNGFDVVREVKSAELTSHIPIIMLSASAALDDRIKSLRLGADAYLTKPFQAEELLLVIKNLLDLRLLWQKRYAHKTGAQLQPTSFPASMDETVKKEDAFMAKIYTIFEEHYTDDTFGLDELCQILGFSRSKLQRKLATLTNHSAVNMLRDFRLQKAYELLQNQPDLNVSTVCFQVGFSNLSHFSRLFSKTFHMSPSEVRPGTK